jgi:hypothetical protein
MQKKALIFPVIAIIVAFVIISLTMIVLEKNKTLTGFVVYSSDANACIAAMNESSTFSANVSCSSTITYGLNITCSNCTLNCENYNYSGTTGYAQTAFILSGTNITIENCNLFSWYTNVSNTTSYSGCGNNFAPYTSSCSAIPVDAPPIVYLNYPTQNKQNNTNLSFFNCSATDDYNVTNLTLYIWNSSSLYYTSSASIIGLASGSANFSKSLTPDGNYTWNCLAYDNASLSSWNNTNFTLTIDTTPPYFSSLANKTINYSQPLSYSISAFDATTSVSCYTVNDTSNFAISCSGLLQNNTLLAIGEYYLNITANDSVNNVNSTIYSVNVTKAIPNITATGATNITYGTASNINCTGTNLGGADLTYSLNQSNGIYKAGTWYFNCSTSGGSNYTGNSAIFSLAVNKATPAIISYINESSGNFSAYNNSNGYFSNIYLNATLNITGIVSMYLDGNLINTGTAPIYNISNLTIGYYNLTAIYSGNENYSSSSDVLWINISQTSASSGGGSGGGGGGPLAIIIAV